MLLNTPKATQRIPVSSKLHEKERYLEKRMLTEGGTPEKAE
jgi:hypothetical protein